MNTHRLLVLALSAAFAVAASAQDAPATRAQVKSDTAQAKKSGELPAGDLDRKPDQVTPGKYPAAPAASAGLSREQVKAEARAAKRAGDVQTGDLGTTDAQKDSARYAGAPEKAPKLHLPHRKPKAAASAASN